MKGMKRIEVILPEGEIADLIDALRKETQIGGYTLIPSVSGLGIHGATVHGLGQLDNSYLLIATELEDFPSLIEAIRPFLKRFGGICLVSDAQRVLE